MVRWADVIVAFGFLLLECPDIIELGKIVVSDIYDPVHLEVLVQRGGDPFDVQLREHTGALAAMNRQLQVSDFFLVASDRQRDLMFGMLAALNRVNPHTYAQDATFDRLISVVPFGLPSEPPTAEKRVLKGVRRGITDDDLVLLWAGGVYEWFDPLSLIRAVAAVNDERVKLFFMGMGHPNPDVPQMAMGPRSMRLAEELGVKDRLVFFNEGWVPYDERAGYLLEADVGVSTHYRHLETAYAFRTRMLDYIWAGLPVLCTEGDTLADLVARRDLGEVVPPDDPAAIEEAIDRLRDPDRRATCSKNLAALADDLRWEKVAQPLVEFCRDPSHAADLAAAPASPAAGAPHIPEPVAPRAVYRGGVWESKTFTAFRNRFRGRLPHKLYKAVKARLR
jgi:glycosyltransferase involved in cell wall biosynthesis